MNREPAGRSSDGLTQGDQAWLAWHQRLAGEVTPLPRSADRSPALRRLVAVAVALIVASWPILLFSGGLAVCVALAGLLVTSLAVTEAFARPRR